MERRTTTTFKSGPPACRGMRGRSAGVALGLSFVVFSGCFGGSGPLVAPLAVDVPPFLEYKPVDPDLALALVETALHLPGAGVDIHARIVRPEGPGPFPVIIQFTPYTAPGRNVAASGTLEPVLEPTPLSAVESRFVIEFVRRGYAFVFADVRGTGDSTGCLDLRGPNDIKDLYELTEYFGTQSWSSGKVGFIGASYPGSEAHMAGLANNPHLAAIVPVVASTSFYHYHHNDGVPYDGQHSLGGTNLGYTQNALTPTLNPQYSNYGPRYAEETTQCPYKENVVDHGGWDQSGAYDEWWNDRNLRLRAGQIQVPVLMGQGLADWNVKPDHIAHWFNDLTVPKTLIAGQWDHQYPNSPCRDGLEPPNCDDAVPYKDWWIYVTAFFDTHLKDIETGMFTSDVAWVQSSDDAWHRSSNWPLLAEERETLTLHLTAHRNLALEPDYGYEDEIVEYSWYGCPHDRQSRGTQAEAVEDRTTTCEEAFFEEIVFESQPFTEDVLISGIPVLKIRVQSDAATTHLVAVLSRIHANGSVAEKRENYGYMNPIFRAGLDSPQPLGQEPYEVSLDFYPQEDRVQRGEQLRLTLRSDDEGRTIEAYEPGANRILIGGDGQNVLELPLRPAELQGLRLEPVSA